VSGPVRASETSFSPIFINIGPRKAGFLSRKAGFLAVEAGKAGFLSILVGGVSLHLFFLV